MKENTETLFSNYPDLNREVLKSDKKYINPLRAWYIFRAYDKKEYNSRGCIPKSQALKVLSHVTPYKKSYLYQILNDGNNKFWIISKHRDGVEYIHYFGIKKIALIFDVKKYSEENILTIEECLLGDVTQVRANLYVTAIGKNSSYTPIARETIAKYYNTSINTQRKYEKITTVPMQKTSSYVLYKEFSSLSSALSAKKELMCHENSNPNCVKIKRDNKGKFLVLYQRGNLYSSIGINSGYPSTLRKCNQQLKRKRKELRNHCQQASDHNDERLVGAPGDKDYQIYFFKSKRSRGNHYNSVLKKDRYVYDKISEVAKGSAYFDGCTKKENICIYTPEFCHNDSPLKQWRVS